MVATEVQPTTKPEETLTVKTDAGEKQMTRREVLAIIAQHTKETRDRLIAEGLDATDNYQQKLLVKYPRLVAHMICESLGYFCPRSVANAINHYKDGQPFYCEWYCSFGTKDIVGVGKQVLQNAIERRHHHKGYMSEYIQARMVVLQELNGNGPTFASWF